MDRVSPDLLGPVPVMLAAPSDLVVGDALGGVPLPVQVTVLALMVGTAVWTAARPGRARAVAFAACAVVWVRANQHLEGAVLLRLSQDHGVTVADLLPPALLALVLARVAPRRTGRVVRHARGRTDGPAEVGVVSGSQPPGTACDLADPGHRYHMERFPPTSPRPSRCRCAVSASRPEPPTPTSTRSASMPGWDRGSSRRRRATSRASR